MCRRPQRLGRTANVQLQQLLGSGLPSGDTSSWRPPPMQCSTSKEMAKHWAPTMRHSCRSSAVRRSCCSWERISSLQWACHAGSSAIHAACSVWRTHVLAHCSMLLKPPTPMT